MASAVSAIFDIVLVWKDGYEILTRYPTDPGHLIVRDTRTAQKIRGAEICKAVSID